MCGYSLFEFDEDDKFYTCTLHLLSAHYNFTFQPDTIVKADIPGVVIGKIETNMVLGVYLIAEIFFYNYNIYHVQFVTFDFIIITQFSVRK